MTRSNRPPAALLATVVVVLLVSAGCLGGSGGPSDAGPGTTDGLTESATSATAPSETEPGETTPAVECPGDADRYRGLAVEHVANESGADPANVSVVNDAFVDYPLLGECYYSAKVRNAESGRTVGVFLAENGTVADRKAVEARAERVYDRRYGNLSRDLYRRMASADADERLSVVVSVADVNRTAAKQAVDRENLTGEEYKEALSAEYERRAEQKTAAVASELRNIDGATVESVGSLRVEVRATPAAIEAIQSLDRVTWLDLRRETTTYVPGTTGVSGTTDVPGTTETYTG